jgi:hypothetical protein
MKEWRNEKEVARRAELVAEAEKSRKLSDERPTYVKSLLEALERQHRRWSVDPPGTVNVLTSTLARNEIIAQHELKQDLGQLAGGPQTYDLDEVARDTLLVHARRDALEALENTKSLLEQVTYLRNAADEFRRSLNILVWFGVSAVWLWQSGYLEQLLQHFRP